MREAGAGASTVPANAAKAGGFGKTALKGVVGVGAILGLVFGLDKLAHPTRPNTTPDNEYGLQPTSVCDMYGEPIMKDFRGILWNKSTYSRLDLKNPPPLHQCSEAELADYMPQQGTQQQTAGGGAAVQKRAVLETKTVSSDSRM